MALNLGTLVDDVRRELSHISEEYLSAPIILQQLRFAEKLAESVCATWEEKDDSVKKIVVTTIAAYFSLLSYASSIETQLGSVPTPIESRIKELRLKAYMFLSNISDVPISPDLIPDTSAKMTVWDSELTYGYDEIYDV